MTAWFNRWSPWAAMIGGVLWVIVAIWWATFPEGCIGAECDLPGRTLRNATPVLPLVVVSLGLLMLGIAGLIIRFYTAMMGGKLAWVGVILLVLGFVTLILGPGLINLNLVSQDLMPYFAIPGGIAVVIGFLLLAINLFRARVLPMWTIVLLVIGALGLAVSNEQNWRVLFWAPCGIAWAIVGFVLWSRQRRAAAPPPAGPQPLP